jgi:hypothetical protein
MEAGAGGDAVEEMACRLQLEVSVLTLGDVSPRMWGIWAGCWECDWLRAAGVGRCAGRLPGW